MDKKFTRGWKRLEGTWKTPSPNLKQTHDTTLPLKLGSHST